MEPPADSLPYRRAPELDGRGGTTPVAIVGAGLTGLALAVDLAQRGVASVLLGEGDRLLQGARGLCWTRRSFEILDRLGVGDRLLSRAVVWARGRIFHGLREIVVETHEMSPDQRYPAYANLRQADIEAALLARCADFPALIDLRFRHRVTDIRQSAEGVSLGVYTVDGRYRIEAGHVAACDGARSPVRGYLGLDFPGRSFADRFLIADIHCALPGPAERLFWFEPPFHPGGSALLHRQPGDLVRLELQLGPDADAEAERLPEAVLPRLPAILGDQPFTLGEVRVWSFAARRLARLRHGRIVFAGDSAHVVPPFGARGGNGALDDVDNLGWKLAAVASGSAPAALLDSYDTERGRAADVNLAHATQSADFLVPPSVGARALRDELVAMAGVHAFARELVNAGRLAATICYGGLALQGDDDPVLVERCGRQFSPGTPAVDVPLGDGWLFDQAGDDACLLCIGVEPGNVAATGLRVLNAGGDTVELVYGKGVYLMRPDRCIAARWATPSAADIDAAYRRLFAR